MSGMDYLGLFVTVLMIALLVYGIVKRYQAAMILLVGALVGIVYYTIVNGSIMGEATIGNAWLDIFEYVASTAQTQLAGNIFILASLMGFVAYCEHCKATTMLCMLLAKPLIRFKKHPMIIVVCIMIFEALMKFVVMSNNAQVALIFSTLFPIMIMLGVTKETAATAMAFACYITWGPANGFTAMYAGMGDLGMSVAEYFMRYDLWNIIVSFGLALVVFVITSKYFDRKDHCEPSPSPIENVDVSTLGCPKWYAIFPLSPIVLIVIFSKLVVGTIVISVPAAAILCWLALFLCEFFRNKDKAQVMADTMKYWKGFGDILCSVGSLIITATLFANTMTKIGALSKLFSLVGQGSGSFNIMLVIVSLAAGALSVLNGNMSGAVPLFGSIMAGICESMNVSFVVAVRTLMPITCTTTALSPISNSSLYCASITNVDIMTIVKRIAAPTITFMISTFIMTMFVLA